MTWAERLKDLGPQVIDQIGESLLTGQTIEEVLGRHMPGRGK
jgi:hypothetical protein